MLPSRMWRLFLIWFFAIVGFLFGCGLTWNIVGNACSKGEQLKFTFWPTAQCKPLDKAQ